MKPIISRGRILFKDGRIFATLDGGQWAIRRFDVHSRFSVPYDYCMLDDISYLKLVASYVSLDLTDNDIRVALLDFRLPDSSYDI